MILNIPIELIENIFIWAIQNDNCNSMKLRNTCKFLNNNKKIILLQDKLNKCDYCKFVFRKFKKYPYPVKHKPVISKYGEILCKIHAYTCSICNIICSYSYFNPIYNKCKKCME